jgi:hypothetical protein
MNKMANWMEGKNRSRDPQLERGHSRTWFRGESSHRRHAVHREISVPPSRERSPPEECHALRQLWQCKGSSPLPHAGWERFGDYAQQVMDGYEPS